MAAADWARVRGPFPERRMNARSTAALLDNPGCVRRAVLDSASVNTVKLAEAAGHPTPFGQSPFAIGQGNRFETRVKADGYVELVRVLAEVGIELPPRLRTASAKRGTNDDRVADTREILRAIATGDPQAANVIDHGMTTLQVGDTTVYLEQDALAFRHEDRLHICEIKGFPLVDGTADPEKVGAAARQSAVYLASLEDTLRNLDLDAGVVSPEVVLICPRNYTIQPTARTVDVSVELRAIRRQLTRRAEIDGVVAGLDLDDLRAPVAPADADDETRAAHAERLLGALPYRYAPACLDRCDLARCCRAEATAESSPCTLGEEAAGLLAAVPTLDAARRLADGEPPTDEAVEVAAVLQRARAAQVALAPTTADARGGAAGVGEPDRS